MRFELAICVILSLVPALIIEVIGIFMDGTQMGARLETIAFVLLLIGCGLTGVLVITEIFERATRPWVSGSAQYQRLKNVTYTQLKSNIEDAERIKQVFYLSAEQCNVTQNIYEKDFGLMLEDLKR